MRALRGKSVLITAAGQSIGRFAAANDKMRLVVFLLFSACQHRIGKAVFVTGGVKI